MNTAQGTTMPCQSQEGQFFSQRNPPHTVPLGENNHQPPIRPTQEHPHKGNTPALSIRPPSTFPKPLETQNALTSPNSAYNMTPGKACDRCRCTLPEETLRLKQEVIRLQNALMEEKDRAARSRLVQAEESNKKVRQLEDYIDRLHDEGAISQLAEEVQELKEKEKNSFLCLEQLSSENKRLQHECQKIGNLYSDLKAKSRLMDGHRGSQGSIMTSRWLLDIDNSEFGDSESIKSGGSYVRQLQESNRWLQKQNKRLSSLISAGMRHH